MKKVKLFCLVLLMAALVKADETITVTGIGGRTISASTTVSVVTFSPTCRTVVMHNSSPSTGVVWYAINCSTSTFATILSGTNAVPLRGGQTHTVKGIPSVTTLCIRGATGTCSVDINAKILED